MTENTMFIIQYVLVLIFGLILSACFADIQANKKNTILFVGLFILCGTLQLLTYLTYGKDSTRALYPIITHLPIVLILCLYYRKNLTCAIASVTTAYLCCQPARWLGLVLEDLTGNHLSNQITYCASLLLIAPILYFLLAPNISDIYAKRHRALLFGCIPMAYYLFDYFGVFYAHLYTNHPQITLEFFPVFLCCVYLLSCIVYYREYEQKNNAERKEHILRIAAEQQAKELELIRRNEQEIRFMRHDLKLLLDNLSTCLDSGDTDTAKKVISAFGARMQSTSMHTYCNNALINYILSDFADKCQTSQVEFTPVVVLDELTVDEVTFSSILINALDNALKAQKELSPEQRHINLMLKKTDTKLLLSIINPVINPPPFVDGLPASRKEGHGFGAKSIRYLTALLHGHCQFTVENQTFILRIVI